MVIFVRERYSESGWNANRGARPARRHVERGLPSRAARISAKNKIPILQCGPPGQRLANIPD